MRALSGKKRQDFWQNMLANSDPYFTTLQYFNNLNSTSSLNYFNVFCHVTLKKKYLRCYLQFNIKLYLIGKGKEYPFEKKIFRSQETHNIPPQKKNLKSIFCIKFFKILKNVIQLGNFFILGDMVVRNFFHQYLSKKKKIKSF